MENNQKKKRIVTIVELLEKEIILEEGETLEDINEKYKNGDIILSDEDFSERSFFYEEIDEKDEYPHSKKSMEVRDLLFKLDDREFDDM